MKNSKTILIRNALLLTTLQVIFIAAIAVPELDPYRLQIAEQTKLSVSFFWIPLLAILTIASIIIFRRISGYLVEPTEELVNQTKLGAASIAFQKKSMNAEEDHLKHFIESQSLRSADLESEINRMEGEVERIMEISKVSPSEFDALKSQLKSAQEEKERCQTETSAKQSEITKLEKELLLLRRELKQSNRDLAIIQNESESHVDAENHVPVSSNLVEKLKTPLSLINNLSWRLAKSWADTPPAQIREGLEEISRHSEEQLALLKKYETNEQDQLRDAQ